MKALRSVIVPKRVPYLEMRSIETYSKPGRISHIRGTVKLPTPVLGGGGR